MYIMLSQIFSSIHSTSVGIWKSDICGSINTDFIHRLIKDTLYINQAADDVKVEDDNDSTSPISSPGPFSIATFNGEGNINQLTGINMFTKIYDAKNPLYSPFQGTY